MKKRRLNFKKLFMYLIMPVIIIIFLIIGLFLFSLNPVSNKSEEVIFEVKNGETYSTLASELKEKNLIKSEISFKIVVKLKKANHLEAGTYKLNKNMSVNEILKYFENGNSYNPNVISITIPEGKDIKDIANIIASTTGKNYTEYLNYWDSEEFVNNVIEKYWFVTDEVKSTNIHHPLEGYFFPSTYEFNNKDVTAEYIAYKFLNQMEVMLNKYKSKIDESSYSIHKLLSLASIVEYEGVYDEDRALIAGVFYNRLEANMKLQSDVTVGYAIDQKKLAYTSSDLKTNSLYNTYYYAGIPVGPVNNPGEVSINAVLNPTDSDYYYFLADICSADNTTYFAKTYEEHIKNSNKYLTCLE